MNINIVEKSNSRETKFTEILKQKKQTILYFYPKDNTSGCSLEARDFSTHLKTFLDNEIQVIGISKDSQESHCKFIEKHGLTIPLISDPELILHKKFGARGEKRNYGKTYEGTIRSTFLLDQSGNIIKERRNVKATGHVEKIIKETIK
ncbi:MAG: peroxiredoxin [Candidatus Absconditabacteria bacterium]|nr:peroxiredoxin [Candidatus Absconditabacteria bacterium]